MEHDTFEKMNVKLDNSLNGSTVEVNHNGIDNVRKYEHVALKP